MLKFLYKSKWISLLLFVLLLTGTLSEEANAATGRKKNISLEKVDDNLYRNPETGYEAMIRDTVNLLQDEAERDLLLEAMKPVTDYGNVIFYTRSGYDGQSVKNRAKSFYEGLYLHDSGSIFMVDMEAREIYIFSHGVIEKTIGVSAANTITDNVYTYASAGRYGECAAKAFEQEYTLLEGGRIAAPMKYIGNALLAFILAILICYAILKQTSQTSRAKDEELIGHEAVREIRNKRKLLYRQERHERSNGGAVVGGGGGSRGGGGGGFSGGSGGGHKF